MDDDDDDDDGDARANPTDPKHSTTERPARQQWTDPTFPTQPKCGVDASEQCSITFSLGLLVLADASRRSRRRRFSSRRGRRRIRFIISSVRKGGRSERK